MLVATLTFDRSDSGNAEAQYDAVCELLGALRRDGHILGTDLPLAQNADQLIAPVLVPAEDAFAGTAFNDYVARGIRKLAAVSLSGPQVSILGEDPQGAEVCDCEERSSLILFTTYISL